MGFNPDEEVQIDRNINKSFIFGNNQTRSALGLARVNAGICGRERCLDIHVVEGSTPLLLSGKWLYDVGAVINFRTGRAKFLELGGEEVQLERAPSYHLVETKASLLLWPGRVGNSPESLGPRLRLRFRWPVQARTLMSS